MIGWKAGGVNVNNFRYVDDAVSEEELKALLDNVLEASAKIGLSIKFDKTISVVINQRRNGNVI